MPDITMCNGLGCAVKDRCMRYLLRPDPNWQSYFAKSPGTDETCEHFIDQPQNHSSPPVSHGGDSINLRDPQSQSRSGTD